MIAQKKYSFSEESKSFTYKKYPSYKDSGIEWIGEIPEGWNVQRLKNSIEKCYNGIWGDDPTGKNDLPCIRVTNFDRKNMEISVENLTYRNIVSDRINDYLLKKGDLLIEKSGGGDLQPVGFVVRYNHDLNAVYANFMAKIKLKSEKNSNFYKYLISSMYALRLNVKAIKQTTGIQNLDVYQYFQEHIPLPTLQEQTKIAEFLDKKTEKIDKIIEKNTELINLLKEKRISLINSAVTKGLDKNVSLKDSGIEWIGEIPDGWEVHRLKFLASKAQYGANCEPEENENKFDVRYIRITDIGEYGNLKDSEVYLCNENSKGFILNEGDILYARSGATVGKVYCYSKTEGKCCYAGYLIRYVPKTNLNPKFLFYYSLSQTYREWIKSILIQSTIENVSAEKYNNLNIPFPPIQEQTKIAQYLDKETEKIDKIILKTEKNIELLKEYKTSLIHNAVTGKIDVRGE